MPIPMSGQSLRQRLRHRWGCVVVVATFLFNFMLNGLLFNYNLLFVAFQEDFKSSATLTGWVGTLPLGISLIIAPFIKLASERFGFRSVALFGVILTAVGVLLTSWLPSLLPMFGSFGLMVGVGAGVYSVCAFDLIVLYFPVKNTMRAVAVATTGSTAGMLAFSQIMAILITKYGWRITLRIMGSLVFAIGFPSVFTFILPSCDQVRDPTRNKMAPNDNPLSVSLGNPSNPSESGTSITSSNDPNEKEPHEKEPLRHKWTQMSEQTPKSEDNCLNTDSDKYMKLSTLDDANTLKKSCEDVQERGMLWRIGRAMTFPEMWLISTAITLNGIGDCFYYVNLINYLISVGFEEQIGVQFMSFAALSNLVTKVLLVLVGEYLPIPRIILQVICNIMNVCVLVSFMLITGVVPLFCISIVVGMTMSISTVVVFSLAPDFFGQEKAMETSTGVYLSYGLGFLLGSLVGQSIDQTGSYTSALWGFIGTYVISGILLLLAPLYQRMFASERFVTFALYRKKREAKKRRKSATEHGSIRQGMEEKR